MRVKPVRARRDDGFIECVADNRVSQPDKATTSIHVYTLDNGLYIALLSSTLSHPP